jgi:hypothetical protein
MKFKLSTEEREFFGKKVTFNGTSVQDLIYVAAVYFIRAKLSGDIGGGIDSEFEDKQGTKWNLRLSLDPVENKVGFHP